MNRKETRLLVESWRKLINEGNDLPVPSSKKELLELAEISQLQNGSLGLHVTFAISKGGKPFWSNKLSKDDAKGGELSGLKGKLVKSQFGYVGLDLDSESIDKLKNKYNEFISEDCRQDLEDTGLKYSLPHHVTLGMGSLSKLSLKNNEGKKIKYDLSSFEGEDFEIKADGICSSEVEGCMICAIKISF